jgi:hypothetical protein
LAHETNLESLVARVRVNSFYHKFLREESHRKAMGDEPVVFVAAFGKHPGWDDHIEDIGMVTESLIQAKQLLYLRGIGGLIDSGAWEKLAAGRQTDGFHHVFVWQRAGRYLIGRLWSSTDGKGRARYPMVVCAHVMGLPLEWAMEHVLPEFERVETACAATRQASEVRRIVEQTAEVLRQRSGQSSSPPPASALADDTRSFTQTAEAKEAFLRVCHQFQQQGRAYEEACRLGGKDFEQVKPQQIRVPMAAGLPAEAFLLWEKFVYLQLPADTPVLLMLSLDPVWLDITMGEPGMDEFFCLRATAKAAPPASAIPYRIEPDLQAQGETLLAAMRSREKPWRVAEVSSRKAKSGNRWSSLLADQARRVMDLVRGGGRE